MRNTTSASDDVNRVVDQNAPNVDVGCVGATKGTITYRLSGTASDVAKVYEAGRRERLW